MTVDLETIRKAYKMDEDLLNDLFNSPEAGIDFDRTWNSAYTLIRCGGCNSPLLRHRAEKCKKTGGGYEEDLVKRFETEIRGCFKIKETIKIHRYEEKRGD